MIFIILFVQSSSAACLQKLVCSPQLHPLGTLHFCMDLPKVVFPWKPSGQPDRYSNRWFLLSFPFSSSNLLVSSQPCRMPTCRGLSSFSSSIPCEIHWSKLSSVLWKISAPQPSRPSPLLHCSSESLETSFTCTHNGQTWLGPRTTAYQLTHSYHRLQRSKRATKTKSQKTDPTKIRSDINTYNYNHSKHICLGDSLKTESKYTGKYVSKRAQ